MEEERFASTLEQGIKIMDDLIKRSHGSGISTIPGSEIFRLYDTMVFLLTSQGILQRTAACRSTRKAFIRKWIYRGKGQGLHGSGKKRLLPRFTRYSRLEVGKTEFRGYDSLRVRLCDKGDL